MDKQYSVYLKDGIECVVDSTTEMVIEYKPIVPEGVRVVSKTKKRMSYRDKHGVSGRTIWIYGCVDEIVDIEKLTDPYKLLTYGYGTADIYDKLFKESRVSHDLSENYKSIDSNFIRGRLNGYTRIVDVSSYCIYITEGMFVNNHKHGRVFYSESTNSLSNNRLCHSDMSEYENGVVNGITINNVYGIHIRFMKKGKKFGYSKMLQNDRYNEFAIVELYICRRSCFTGFNTAVVYPNRVTARMVHFDGNIHIYDDVYGVDGTYRKSKSY